MTAPAENRSGAGQDRPWRLLVDDDAAAAQGLALDEALMSGYARGKPAAPWMMLFLTTTPGSGLVSIRPTLPPWQYMRLLRILTSEQLRQ